MIATSLTYLAIGPGVSWSAVIGMTPYRLMRPTVGLIAASMFWFDGLRFRPDVARPEVRRRADAGARSAGLHHRMAVGLRRGHARVAPRVVRIEPIALDAVVIGRHVVGDEVRQLGQPRLRDDDRA